MSDEEIEQRLRNLFGPSWDGGDWPEELKEAFRKAERERPPPRELTPEEIEEQRQRAEERVEAAAERRAFIEGWLHRPVRDTAGNFVRPRQVAEERRQNLAQRADDIRERQRTARAAALELPVEAGHPTRFESPDGGSVAELMAISPHGPLFYRTMNLGTAETSFTDRLWSGQATGFPVTGSGHTVGIWDAGRVRETHDEFAPLGRVVQKDGFVELDSHATRVAGTLIAADTRNFGTPYGLAAKGMSPAAEVDAYHWADDIAEMIDAALNDGLLVSNHSLYTRARTT